MKPFSKKSQSRSAPQGKAGTQSSPQPGDQSLDNYLPDDKLTYSCTIKPSFIHRALLLLVGLMAAVAILICKISIVLQVIAWLITGAVTIFQWHKLQKHWQLQHHAGDENTANHWALQSDSGEYIDGRLLPKGYRSASLLVLAIGAESGRSIMLPVWIDSVSPTQFSYLNLQLMFNTRGRI